MLFNQKEKKQKFRHCLADKIYTARKCKIISYMGQVSFSYE